ncbi:hypothetical protein F2Q70_00011867 [Brassica cretica]|uniref:Uncharacterized protein n=1 Tax=Brassica cretica TaxID=69181 RepID=A0A8S9M898_BRACR|nr:hypothetical protein F2Q70_00011867 [Brassica cretica]
MNPRWKRNRDRDEGLTNLGAVIRLGEGDDGIRWGFRSKEQREESVRECEKE